MKKLILVCLIFALISSVAAFQLRYTNTQVMNYYYNLLDSNMKIERQGSSLLGRGIYLVTYKATPKIGVNPKDIFILARQHGVESSGSFVLEGMFSEIKQNKNLLKYCNFYIVPDANPDGMELNNAFNSKGINLNRVWMNPDETAYETAINRRILKQVHDKVLVNYVIDVHGFNGQETQDKILYMNLEGKNMCGLMTKYASNYKCEQFIYNEGRIHEYSINSLGIKNIVYVEHTQNLANYTQDNYRQMGKKIIKGLCEQQI